MGTMNKAQKKESRPSESNRRELGEFCGSAASRIKWGSRLEINVCPTRVLFNCHSLKRYEYATEKKERTHAETQLILSAITTAERPRKDESEIT